ncbi:MAG: dienelactone hydrolase family protein [Deltaproteobacteria bacterium]|nr:dienelactone hydrolase family protein [Deltaproteobacteria bacterium]MCL4874392.1 dienelactone hydrolase family protein [bacterium]
MMKSLIAVAAALLLFSANAQAKIVGETIEYNANDTVLEGYLVYDDEVSGPRPGVLVFHEWWGINDYIKGRADELARLGYVAFAPDMYGKGVRPTDPKAAGEAAGKLRADNALMRSRAMAGLEALREVELADTSRMAAIGYCFGGGAALELGRSGAPVAGTVTFHGSLATKNPARPNDIKGSVLVLHGAEDPHVKPEDVRAFKDEMRTAGADWVFTSYGGAVHGFSNPNNDADPSDGLAYNEKADKRSWEAMKDFLKEVFGGR